MQQSVHLGVPPPRLGRHKAVELAALGLTAGAASRPPAPELDRATEPDSKTGNARQRC